MFSAHTEISAVSSIDRQSSLTGLPTIISYGTATITMHIAIPADKISTRLNYYADPTDRSHKIYITDKLFRQLQKPDCILG